MDKFDAKECTLNAVSEDLLSRYKRQLADSKERNSNLEKLIKLLEDNPQTLEIMQLMGRV